MSLHSDPVTGKFQAQFDEHGQTCHTCRERKDYSQFSRNRARPSGYAQECKACRKADYEANRTDWRGYALTRRYGITLEHYDELLVRQRRRCATCPVLDRGRTLQVDHDHETGRVRGLLCGRCNQMAGLIERKPDSYAVVPALLAYLEVT